MGVLRQRLSSALVELGANLLDPSQLKTSTNVHRSSMYVPGADILYGVGFKANISLARSAYKGKPTTTKELASRGTLHHGEHGVSYHVIG